MKQRYIYKYYRYRSEWRVKRTPCRILPGPGYNVEPTGPSEIIETGLDRVSAIFMVGRLYNEQNEQKPQGV